MVFSINSFCYCQGIHVLYNTIQYEHSTKKKSFLLIVLLLIGESQSIIFIDDQYVKYKEIENNHMLKNDIKYDYISRDIVEEIHNNSQKTLLILNES